MKRIKVTGFMDVEDLNEEHIDLDDDMGISSAGFDHYNDALMRAGLTDIDFELVDED